MLRRQNWAKVPGNPLGASASALKAVRPGVRTSSRGGSFEQRLARDGRCLEVQLHWSGKQATSKLPMLWAETSCIVVTWVSMVASLPGLPWRSLAIEAKSGSWGGFRSLAAASLIQDQDQSPNSQVWAEWAFFGHPSDPGSDNLLAARDVLPGSALCVETL